jgi:hypothetical protein
MQPKIVAKVLSYHKSQRYMIVRTLQSAWNDLAREWPKVILEIVEVRDVAEILKYTQVFAFASLMINDQLVCIGRCPKRNEVTTWLKAAIAELNRSPMAERDSQ